MLGYSPLLSGAYTRQDRALPPEYNTSRAAKQVNLLQSQARAVGLDAGQLVLAWMGQRDTPVIPIVGVSRPEHGHSAWEAVTTEVPQAVLAELEDNRG